VLVDVEELQAYNSETTTLVVNVNGGDNDNNRMAGVFFGVSRVLPKYRW
jgi:hypothetical protein